MALRILLVGETVSASRTLQRVRVLGEMGHAVGVIPTQPPGASYETRPGLLRRLRHRLRLPGDPARANREILAQISAAHWDLLWLDRAVEIRPSTLRAAKAAQPGMRLVWYAEDDMMNPRHRSRWVDGALPLFDLWVTTKSFNAHAGEMPTLGARRVMFVNNSYDPALHRPVVVSEAERAAHGADISFVGTFEAARAASLLHLARAGLGVRVWGNGWAALEGRERNLRIENRPAYDAGYAKVVCASAINLCFLRRDNRDLQTCRSVEIPAFGGFMLHERNSEITGLFAEDREAAYFGDDDELVEQCRKWLADAEGRRRIAEAGLNAVISGGHGHPERLEEIIGAALERDRT
jgi:hypothetical protein